MTILKQYLRKFYTTTRSPLPIYLEQAWWAFVGGTIAVLVLESLSRSMDITLLIAPFGASCVLAFALPEAPLSQPRNIIGGHFITTLCGLIIAHLFGHGMWALALGVGLGIAAMLLTKTTHPPAGANPIIVITSASSWSFLFQPVLIGSIVIVCIALLYNNLFKNKKYPSFWL
ncbi:HPP family protein [Paenibacillus sp. WLX1005]|uniref:HPP family protein n=1 Tax=Paenibacillus sp. WLX1005 TaxID=3243766 RepID=UPI003983EDE3